MRARKLTDQQVRELRALWKPQPKVRDLAKQYGISRQSLRKLLLGHTYKEIWP